MVQILTRLLLVLVLLVHSVNSYRSSSKSMHSHKNITHDPQKMKPQLSFQITLHALLLWSSVGFLMPLGILIVRMSHKVQCCRKLKLLFYCHLFLQITAVLIALAGAALSVKYFENSFDNTHQKIGLGLYAFILIQPLIGFYRPKRGVKLRSLWYFVHWLIGTGVCIMGIVNIYIGLHAFHAKTSKSVRLWIVLFTAEIFIFVFVYLMQDRWEHMKKQGVILGNEQIRPTDQSSPSNQKDGNEGLVAV
ncbi:Cytochrome b561/ferric reductase transmembrane domain-containing protein [Dioscorea alata]|uniref:Cytochrome b561/ferric reductase transmembrane domain-containing protein n=1 Tax=Dioscorea alata TaxID=55571 RepID=A0ACB7WD60_DIOAL|nr:Cytochrome b561/ferric reductase transmembrane domain-containing protein [Dioscorea alata]